jgi:hypothetical protein
LSAFRTKRRAAAPALALLLRAGALPLAAAVALAPRAALAQPETYKPHMENGVKLYNDKNYPAAIVEFEAAYKARPNANPLVNIALCEKELFHYPKAIAALEAALAKHGDTMSPSDRKAAEDAIKDMRALLGRVVVKLNPANATLVVDGEELPAGAADKEIELGPGAHKVAAHAEGFASAERTVTVASGQAQVVSIELAADGGLVTVHAPDPKMTVTVDQRIVGTGTWSGVLSPGAHTVQVSGANDAGYEGQIMVVRGQPLDLRAGAGLVAKKPTELPMRRGVYLLASGSILFPLVHPPDFYQPHTDFGAGFGVRVGFQVNNTAGFDLSYQHSAIQTYKSGDPTGTISYRLVSERVALGLRLSTPGKMWRFVATVAGGVVYDQVQWGENVHDACMDTSNCRFPTKSEVSTTNVHGLDAFGMVETVAELDVDRVLIDLGMEAQFQSTGNISSGMTMTTFAGSIFGTRPIINIGPAVRIGYRFW